MSGWTVDKDKSEKRGADVGLTSQCPFHGTPTPVAPSPPPRERGPFVPPKRSWLIEWSVLLEDTFRSQNRRHAWNQIAFAVVVLAVVVGLCVGVGWGMR